MLPAGVFLVRKISPLCSEACFALGMEDDKVHSDILFTCSLLHSHASPAESTITSQSLCQESLIFAEMVQLSGVVANIQKYWTKATEHPQKMVD